MLISIYICNLYFNVATYIGQRKSFLFPISFSSVDMALWISFFFNGLPRSSFKNILIY